ncbi:hypothetical protein IE53DRAFT_382164 [Violaceomyces palustris]|uniref:Uncharacterized protein n=1 Tax=Violaceomyces palustris TaxID=1673888 RepID=A0ACD0NNM5_9BASI|nr:hypothetical protein IE53DRAFT_382164 [Violaceomyces palustris]
MKATMRLVSALSLCSLAAYGAPSWGGSDTVGQLAFNNGFQSTSFQWLTKAIGHVASRFGSPTADRTIWEIINSEEEFKQLAHVFNYSSDATKKLLDAKDGKLTMFAPVNWHKERDPHHRDPHHGVGEGMDESELGLAHASAAWSRLGSQISSYEAEERDLDEGRRERRRSMIRHLVDAVARYHLVRSDRVIDAKTLADNSSVATYLNTEKSGYRFNDGTDWRVRTGKSLFPLPSIKLNFYSPIVKPDIEASNGLIHAIKYPLLPPPDVLQSLFFGHASFSSSTSALQKVHAAQYLSYRPYHHGHHGGHHGNHTSFDGPAPSSAGSTPSFDGPSPSSAGSTPSLAGSAPWFTGSTPSFTGVPAETIFVPTNLAWLRLPFGLRAYLLSPFGYHRLQQIFMLHSLPFDIVYADFVHHVAGKHHGKPSEPTLITTKEANVTKYTFDSVLPALDGEEGKYEQVDVAVYRYKILPGGRGPLQTRITVQEVPVLFQDIPANNGVFHAIDRFIKPKGHPKVGLWAQIAQDARLAGFGSVDLEREAALDLW